MGETTLKSIIEQIRKRYDASKAKKLDYMIEFDTVSVRVGMSLN